MDLSARLARDIPISNALGVTVVSVSPTEVILRAPLAPNINHEGTVFGGSIHSVALLACWSLATLALQSCEVDYVVVQDSSITYSRPIASDFTARASASREDLARFETTLRKHGRARISMTCEIENGSATLEARFVAQVKKT